jgi:hypothetical protein
MNSARLPPLRSGGFTPDQVGQRLVEPDVPRTPTVGRISRRFADRNWPVVLATILLVGMAATLRAAERGSLSYETPTPAEELKGLGDPTILKRRLWLETEWNKFRDGSHTVEETLGGLWAWRVAERQDWGVRLKVPYIWHVAGEGVGDSDANGLGDLQFATGTAFHLGQSWRAAGGLELRTPTAQHDLGDNVWRLQEFGALAWDATRWLTLSPSAEYNQSLAELHSTSPQHYLEMYFPATFLLPRSWSVSPRYELKVDFEKANYVTHSAKLLVAKQLNTPPLGFALSLKRSFDSGQREFQVNFVLTYYFQ